MKKRVKASVLAAAILLFSAPAGSMAAQIKGKIQSISGKAKAIQMADVKTNKVEVIRFNDDTRFLNAGSYKELIPDDVVLVDYEPGSAAKSIKRLVVEVPPEKLVDTQRVAAVIEGSASDYLLVDARPGKRYDEGHIPTAISIPTDQFDRKKGLLPEDKGKLIIFYCGGPT